MTEEFNVEPTDPDSTKPIVLSQTDYAQYQILSSLKDAILNLTSAIRNMKK